MIAQSGDQSSVLDGGVGQSDPLVLATAGAGGDYSGPSTLVMEKVYAGQGSRL